MVQGSAFKFGRVVVWKNETNCAKMEDQIAYQEDVVEDLFNLFPPTSHKLLSGQY